MNAASEWHVFGVCNTNSVNVGRVTSIRLNLIDYAELRNVFSDIRPDAVIHAAAYSQPNYCERNPLETRKVNVEVPSNIAGLCADFRVPCVFTSSDLVFDGLKPPYAETSEVNPICVYGEQKAEAEEAMLRRYPETAICRMPLMFGYTEGAGKSFDPQMIRTLLEGKRIRLFSDEYRTPVDSESAAKGLLLMLSKVRGIIHLGGRTRISRYEMGQIVARLLNIDKSLIKPVLQNDISMPARRPPDVSLVSSKAYTIGYDPHDIEAAYQEILIRSKFLSGVQK